jgi:hypothetical protein
VEGVGGEVVVAHVGVGTTRGRRPFKYHGQRKERQCTKRTEPTRLPIWGNSLAIYT